MEILIFLLIGLAVAIISIIISLIIPVTMGIGVIIFGTIIDMFDRIKKDS